MHGKPSQRRGSEFSVANSHHAHQGFLDVDELALALVFFLRTIRESLLQKDQIPPEFEAGREPGGSRLSARLF